MTLAQANTIIQILANVAVVASVLFVAVQASQGVRMLKEAAERNHMDKHQSVSRMLSENPQLAELWGRGSADGMDRLSNAGRVQFVNFYMYILRIWEELFLQHLKGLIDERLWSANIRVLRDTQVVAGAKEAWTIRKHLFTPAFREFYEKEAEQGDARPLYGKPAARTRARRVRAATENPLQENGAATPGGDSRSVRGAFMSRRTTPQPHQRKSWRAVPVASPSETLGRPHWALAGRRRW